MINYYNTGSPLYDGIPFTTYTELLTLIKVSLESSTWQTIIDDIAINKTLVMQGKTTNDHICTIKFFVDSNSSNYFVIQGILDDINSPALDLEFTPNEPNKLWLTADQDSGVICIRNKLLYSGAITFGFLERFDETDADAWAIAYLNNRLNHAYVARAKHDGVIWKKIGSDFAEADNFTSATNNGGYQGIIDFIAIPNPYISFFNTNLRNAGYSAHFGQVATTDRPIITRRFYLEGRGDVDNYESLGDNPAKLYNRGFVKHVANGFGKIPQGKIEQDENGNRYLSVGGDGWQGMKLNQSQITNNELPTIFRSEAGIVFSLADNLNSEIKTTLLNAQWEIIAENATRLLFKGKHALSENCCYLRMELNSNQVIIGGDAVGDESNLSPTLSLSFTESVLNRLWISANQQAIALCIKDAGDNSYKGIWFGFLRGSNSRWGFGYIKSDINSNYLLTENAWRVQSISFTPNFDSFSSFPSATFDRLTTAATPLQYYDRSDPKNSAYKAYNGQINGATNQPQLDFYGIVEGNKSATSEAVAFGTAYGLSEGEGNAPKLNYLGTVYFAATGLASVGAGEIVTTTTGAKYMSVGGNGWQGMRIS